MLLRFISNRRTLNSDHNIRPVSQLTTVRLVRHLRVVTTLRHGGHTLALSPTFQFRTFMVPVQNLPHTPKFIIKRHLNNFNVHHHHHHFITLTRHRFNPRPPHRATIANILSGPFNTNMVTLLVVRHNRTVDVFRTTTYTILRRFSRLLFILQLLAG